ncbi:putative type IV piliation system protein DR_0774 [Deinococcus xinjiangensis]|uniref:Type IV piliation system protein DR_0774 n=1 Tax=Deinococcus xinjiangensis TaxID=457454 RepID=A0ABP9VBH6_9DEIO
MTKRHVLLLTAVLGMASAQSQSVTTPNASNVSNAIKNAVADPNLTNEVITVNTGTYVGPLSTLLASIAKSARYDVVFNFNVDALALINGEIVKTNSPATQSTNTSSPEGTDNIINYATPLGRPAELPARPVVYNFISKPFNQVWPLLMDVYDLQYEVINLGSGKIIRISQRPAQLAIPLRFITAKYAEQKALEFFGVPSYNELPIYDNQGKVVDKVRQFDRYVLTSTSMRILADIENNRLIAGGTSEESAKIRSFVSTIDVPKIAADSIPQARTVYEVKSNTEDAISVLKSQFPDLVATPVGKTSQIIITGDQSKISTAISLLNQVDKPAAATPTGPQTVQKVFQLVNASAEEVKATLEGTLARDLNAPVDLSAAKLVDPVTGQPYVGTLANAPMNQQTTTPATTAPTATAQTTTATIIADKRTNTVIVRGTQIQVNQVAELIPQLDKVVPQINVQVRIQEITQQATRSLGLDWAVNFGGFKVKLGSAGVGATFDPTQSLMGFNIFPTLNALETQNLAKKVYDGSITMQSGQRALTSNGLTANVSSTAAASIKSGGRLEVSIPSSAANVAAIQRQIDYGVNLDFFDPQVAPDGSITLRVRGQVNDLTTKIPDNGVGVPNILQFTNSEAQSVVTFKSGQTLLLTGLMGNKSTESNKGVPYLSSIPVIGAAFGSQTYDKSATQLLVVITGTVVQ